jgi:hypothetical protein
MLLHDFIGGHRMSRTKNAAAGFAAALIMLAALATTASAAHLRDSSQNIRAVWTGLEYEAGVTVRCPVTVEGSFHSSTISKTAGALIGYISRAIIGEASCSGGRARTLTENLPWHIRYASFEGTLPNITRVNLNVIGIRFLLLATFPIIGSVSCLYVTEASHPATMSPVRENGGAITSVAAGGSINGTGICPEGRFGGSGRVSVLGTTTAISVTLI